MDGAGVPGALLDHELEAEAEVEGAAGLEAPGVLVGEMVAVVTVAIVAVAVLVVVLVAVSIIRLPDPAALERSDLERFQADVDELKRAVGAELLPVFVQAVERCDRSLRRLKRLRPIGGLEKGRDE